MTKHLPPPKLKRALRPGQFAFGKGGTVHEVDNLGRMHPRPDLAPKTKGPWKHQHYKKP